MSARPSLTAAIRCRKTLLPQQCAHLSSTSKKSSFKDLNSTSSSPNPFARPATDDGPSRSNLDAVAALYQDSTRGKTGRSALMRRETTERELSDSAVSQSYVQQMPRRWKVGDVYAPRDLSPYEVNKWRGGSQAVKRDILDMLGLNPLDNYRNFAMISEYMTSYGRIKHSDVTGLRPVNQRKMAKAIRRAIGLGLHPSVHHHPELIMLQPQNISRQTRVGEAGMPVTPTGANFR